MHTLSPGDLFDLRFIRSGQLSPGAEFVAYTVSATADDDERVELFVGPVDGPHARVEIEGGRRAEHPAWSPGGDRLAIVVDGRLRTVSFPELQVSPPLSPDDLVLSGRPSWAPDGVRIAASLIRLHPPVEPRTTTEYAYRADGLGYIDGFDQGIYEIDTATSNVRRLVASAAGLCMNPRWSPVADELLFAATDEAVPYASYSPSLCLVDVATGEIRTLLDHAEWYLSDAQWAPGGARIVVVGSRDSAVPVPYTSVWTMERDGSGIELRTPGMLGKPGMHIHHDMPAWDLTAGNVTAVPSDEYALVSVQSRGSVEILRVGLRGDPSIGPVHTGDRACIVLDADATADRLLYVVSEFGSPTELWASSLDGRDPRRLTRLNDDVLGSWPQFTVAPFEVTAPDGLRIDAWFLAKEGSAGPLPTVLYIHGGPYIASGAAFRFDLLMLAAQGFGVVFSNFRGSAGYGEEHAQAVAGAWGANGFPDHMATVDRAIELGHADAERLGVWGASHGGFATLWIVTHTDRFRAAVAEASVSDFTTTYYLSDAPDSFAREMGGPPHLVPDVYRERSPLTYVSRCTTPTMLVHGENDLRCPISEAEQFYRALHDVGCPTELVRLGGADHLGDSLGPLSARLGQNTALARWFGQRL